MIRVGRVPGGALVREWAAPPIVYLDHCALGQIAETPGYQDRFLRTLEARDGTLALSFLTLAEIACHDAGPSSDRIASLICGVGTRFIFLQGAPRQSGTDQRLSAALIRSANCPDGPVHSAVLVDFLRAGMNDARTVARRLKAEFGERTRQEWEELRRNGRTLNVTSNGTAEDVCYDALLRAAFKSGKTFTDNDSVDLFHAASQLTKCDLVVLDRTWAEFARQVPQPPRIAAVFSVKKGQVSAFLDALESFVVPPEFK